MRILFATTAVVLVLSTAWQSFAYTQSGAQVQADLKPVMQRKLDYSKSLLEGLATEDLEEVARNAQALSLLSTESAWNVMVTDEYLRQSNAFRRSLEAVREGAKEGNVDRAALGYVEMTIRCVECHKYVRKTLKQMPEPAKDVVP